MLGRDADGPLWIRVLGRDEADAQLVAKVWRGVALQGRRARPCTSPGSQDVEHEAYALLLAERAGVRVPPVIVAGTAGRTPRCSSIRPVDGRPLIATPIAGGHRRRCSTTSGDQLARIHAARVAHGALQRAPPRRRRPTASPSRTSSSRERRRIRRAARRRRRRAPHEHGRHRRATTGRRGRARAALGKEALDGRAPVPAVRRAQPRHARPHAQRSARRATSRSPTLRDAAAAAVADRGAAAPAALPGQRHEPAHGVGTLIAVFALLSARSATPRRSTRRSRTPTGRGWPSRWSSRSSRTSRPRSSLMGTVPINLPLIRTAELQLSMSFSNLAVPGGRRHGRADPVPPEAGRRPRVGRRVGRAADQRRQHRRCTHPASSSRSRLSPTTHRHGRDPGRRDRQGRCPRRRAHRGSRPCSSSRCRSCGSWCFRRSRARSTTMWDALRSPRRVFAAARRQRRQRADVRRRDAVLHLRVRRLDQLLDAARDQHLRRHASRPWCRSRAAAPRCPRSACRARSPRSASPTEIAVAAVLANQLVANFIPAVPGWFATNDLLHDDYL